MNLRTLVERLGEADAAQMNLVIREAQAVGSAALYEIDDARVVTILDEDNAEACDNCDGTGELGDEKCPVCKGEGDITPETEVILIDLSHAGYAPTVKGDA